MKIKKGDIIITICALALSFVLFLSLKYLTNTGNSVVIEVNGETVKTCSLSDNTQYDVLDENGNVTNTIVIENGYVDVTYATCKDKICEKHNKINKSGESIICLPNSVVVTVESDNNEIDGVAR